MTLQLPSRGAPPSNHAWDVTASASASGSMSASSSSPAAKTSRMSKTTTTSTRSASNIKINAKKQSGIATSTSTVPPFSALLQSQRSSSSMYTTRNMTHDDMNSIRALENQLHHTSVLLQNTAICERLPGGRKGLQDRFDALMNRLNHLYAVHEIERRFRVTQLEDDKSEDDVGDHQVKKEESDQEALEDMRRLSLSSANTVAPFSPLRSSTHGHAKLSDSSPSSASASSPNGRRTFKQEILDRSFGPSSSNSGRVAHLSMQESLLLSERESARMMAQRRMEDEADEREAALARARAEVNVLSGRARKAGTGGKKVEFARASAYDIGTGPAGRGGGAAEGPDGDDEDYDWSTEGYYDET